jgi:hypothetical protein
MANIELIPLRKFNEKHFIREDGKMQAEIYLNQIHYKDENGDLQDIVSSWELEDGFGYKVKKAKHNLRIIGNKLRFGFKKGSFIDYELPDELIPNGKESIINDAWLNSDLKYINNDMGIKGDIILKSPGHPNEFNFPISTTNCEIIQDGNKIYFYDNDELLGSIPEPYMVDNEGNIGPVALEYNNASINIKPDLEWLNTAIYPVKIDPTTTIQPDGTAGKDTYIDEGNPTTSYETATAMRVGESSGNKLYALIEFDLSSIGSDQYITDSQFGMRVDSLGGSANTNVKQITSSWVENVTWNTKPTFISTALDTVLVNASGVFFDWDVTDITFAWYNGTVSNYGLLVDSDSSTFNQFISSDSGTSDRRPRLVITHYTKPTVTITTLNGTEGSPTALTDEVSGMTLSGVYTSSIPVSMTHKQHQIFDEDDNLIWDSDFVADSKTTGQTVSAIVPDIPLKYGIKYYWRWRAKDTNTAISDWSTKGYFISTLTAPLGLNVTNNNSLAQMELDWTAHSGENLAGYNIYRREYPSGSFEQINTSLVTSNGYDDQIASSGVEYEYYVTAVAEDGFESVASGTDTGTLTITGFWINDEQVNPLVPVEFNNPRRASYRIRTDSKYEIQDLGLLPRIARFVLRYENKTERDDLLDLFTSDTLIEYRDEQGETFAGKVVTTLAETRLRTTKADFYGNITFEAAEVVV